MNSRSIVSRRPTRASHFLSHGDNDPANCERQERLLNRGDVASGATREAPAQTELRPTCAGASHANRQVKIKLNIKMFWAIFVLLLVLWAVGLICHIAFSHFVLVIALIILIVRLVRGRAPRQ
jgi:Flp pilus assembly protein TadB